MKRKMSHHKGMHHKRMQPQHNDGFMHAEGATAGTLGFSDSHRMGKSKSYNVWN